MKNVRMRLLHWCLVACCQLATFGCQRQSAPTRDPGRGRAHGASLADKGDAAAPVRAVCDSIAAGWHTVTLARVVTVDTTVSPLGADSAATDVPACRVTATLDSTVDTTSTSVLFWPRSNWPMDPTWMADGPDGQTKVYQRGLVRCEVGESWDGGDDTDTTYVPSPWTEETSTCYESKTPLKGSAGTDAGKTAPKVGRGSLLRARQDRLARPGRHDGVRGTKPIELAATTSGCDRMDLGGWTSLRRMAPSG
jgi:hypothetical protein